MESSARVMPFHLTRVPARILVMAVTRGPADVFAYMPAIAWRSGTSMVVWNGLA